MVVQVQHALVVLFTPKPSPLLITLPESQYVAGELLELLDWVNTYAAMRVYSDELSSFFDRPKVVSRVHEKHIATPRAKNGAKRARTKCAFISVRSSKIRFVL